jgi:hypothetical protein
MWTAHALKSFSAYVQNTPKHLLGKLPVRGAYDARSSARGHGHSGRLHAFDFEPGGELSLSGASGGDVHKSLCFLASKLSAEDWAELQSVLTGGGEAEDEPPAFKGRPTTSAYGSGRLDDPDPAPKMGADAGYYARFPESKRIGNRQSGVGSYAERFPDAKRIGIA